MLPWRTRLLLITGFYLALPVSTSMAASANTIIDDSPAAILYSGSSQQNPIVHLSNIDRTITATTTPLCPYDVHLDGQWQGNVVASDGKVYFGTSSHAPHTSALFMQYDPATGLVHRLASLNEITHEDVNFYRPQGKLHSAMTEYNGYLYFSTYYGYEGGNYPGGHVIRYKLGSFEANSPVFKDMGLPTSGGIIYTATTVDPLTGIVYVNDTGGSGTHVYTTNANAPDSTTFTWTDRGGVASDSTFYHFTDSQDNLWTTGRYTGGTLYEVPPTGNMVSFPGVFPTVLQPDNLSVNWMTGLNSFNWVRQAEWRSVRVYAV